MNICFLDFWYDFQLENNFFIHALRQIQDNVHVTGPLEADLIIYTCFGNQEHRQYNHCKKIFYTGENLRPNYAECDYSITFDFDDYGSRNIRIPLWYLYFDWFNVKSYGNPNWLIPLSYIDKENEFTVKIKDKFCSTVFSAHHNNRYNMIEKLNTYKSVDCYGKLPNFNYIPEGEKNKMDLISHYKFNMCFENTIYPGYFTEKLVHAKIAGTIPIYYADTSVDHDFNKSCCINVFDYTSIDDALDYIKLVDSDNNTYNMINAQPLFTTTPDLSKILNEIKKLIQI